MKDKMPTLHKIKRAASPHTCQSFCSTFNFAHPHPRQFSGQRHSLAYRPINIAENL